MMIFDLNLFTKLKKDISLNRNLISLTRKREAVVDKMKVNLMSWFDNKDVNLLSTIVGSEPTTSKRHYVPQEKNTKAKLLPKPWMFITSICVQSTFRFAISSVVQKNFSTWQRWTFSKLSWFGAEAIKNSWLCLISNLQFPNTNVRQPKIKKKKVDIRNHTWIRIKFSDGIPNHIRRRIIANYIQDMFFFRFRYVRLIKPYY